MNREKRLRTLDALLFLSCIAILSGWPGLVLLILKLPVLAYFYLKRKDLLGPSLFLVLLHGALLMPSPYGIWVLNIIGALALYLVIVFTVKPVKEHTGWLRIGAWDRYSVRWIILLFLVSSGALIIWTGLFEPELDSYFSAIPDVSLALLLPGLLVFSIFNALGEEAVFRGIFWEGLERTVVNIPILIFIQAALFGLAHVQGFPRGVVGIILAFIYGIFLGIMRYHSKGLLVPVCAHILTDCTIGTIVLKLAGRI